MRLATMLNEAVASPLSFTVAAQTVAPEAAASHIGEQLTIKGTVAEVYKSRSGVTFLDMGGRYPNNVLTGVILPEDAGKLSDVSSLIGKAVEITGTVRLYRGKA